MSKSKHDPRSIVDTCFHHINIRRDYAVLWKYFNLNRTAVDSCDPLIRRAVEETDKSSTSLFASLMHFHLGHCLEFRPYVGKNGTWYLLEPFTGRKLRLDPIALDGIICGISMFYDLPREEEEEEEKESEDGGEKKKKKGPVIARAFLDPKLRDNIVKAMEKHNKFHKIDPCPGEPFMQHFANGVYDLRTMQPVTGMEEKFPGTNGINFNEYIGVGNDFYDKIQAGVREALDDDDGVHYFKVLIGYWASGHINGPSYHVILQGPAGCGKSLIGKLLELFAGDLIFSASYTDNSSDLPVNPKSKAAEWAGYNLIGKRCVYLGEVNLDVWGTSYFTNLSEKEVNVRKKGDENGVKVTRTCNGGLLHVNNTPMFRMQKETSGMLRRVLLVFVHPLQNPDPSLYDALMSDQGAREAAVKWVADCVKLYHEEIVRNPGKEMAALMPKRWLDNTRYMFAGDDVKLEACKECFEFGEKFTCQTTAAADALQNWLDGKSVRICLKDSNGGVNKTQVAVFMQLLKQEGLIKVSTCTGGKNSHYNGFRLKQIKSENASTPNVSTPNCDGWNPFEEPATPAQVGPALAADSSRKREAEAEAEGVSPPKRVSRELFESEGEEGEVEEGEVEA